MTHRVVGIDPSLASSGVARVDGSLATIKTDPKKHGDGGRLLRLRRELAGHIQGETGELRRPALVVIEDLPTHAKSAGLTGRAQGIVRMTLAEWDLPYVAIPPATLKKFATGKGNAKKELMREAWLQFSGDDVPDDNQVDAAWLRQVGLLFLGEPVELPDEQLAAVEQYTNIRET